jgi:hypothetical protein
MDFIYGLAMMAVSLMGKEQIINEIHHSFDKFYGAFHYLLNTSIKEKLLLFYHSTKISTIFDD